MEELTLHIPFKRYDIEELNEADRTLVEAARQATFGSYAPYSHFKVGAAVRLTSGMLLTGNNQENASYPCGTCAERSVLFYANANYPAQSIETIAIAARNEQDDFLQQPISPCGLCRQVMVECEQRQQRPLRVLLYGTKGVYEIAHSKELLPFSFDGTWLEPKP